ncbi:unnamed protein product [Polarella glacialis]|uniref:Uncharacterized protein n=2 Tax=Polarella glacialis TaxID=89957 RepID=A0A813I939_POLGL|nr:unnamed protein product [Polarella glacialis]
MHVPAAAAAAGTALTGKWLFDYNRANFQNDVPQRFARFMSSRNMLNAQVGQYRQDVAGLVTLTTSKMDAMSMMITLILAVNAALSDAGRIGMHGAAPPQWLCGLYSGCIASSVMLMGTALWLSMHASLRAQCAMVSLLTRKVRLPIPSMAQLDNARGCGSGFEQQKFGDIFRVPFMRHPEAAPQPPEQSDDEDETAVKGKKKGKKAPKVPDARTEFTSTTRDTVPSWIRDEQVVDKAGGVMRADAIEDSENHEIPEHFQLLAKAQEEWWQYDVYARILMLFGTIQFLFAVTYYSIGTTMAELRGFWISWSLPMMFLVGQALILRLDIVKGAGNHLLPHAEWFGHLAPYFAIAATTLEYRSTYKPENVTITWVLVFLCYAGHFTMALRMLDLAWPDYNHKDMPDEAGKTWWPSHWTVPSAFGKNLWLLSPPKKLEPGEHDLLHEMESLQRSSAGVTCRRRRKGAENEVATASRAASSPEALQAESSKLENSFQGWFEESVWAQVPEEGQRSLTDLWGQYVATQGQINQLASGKASGEKTVPKVSDALAEIAENLAEFEATHKRGEGAYTGASPFKEFGTKRAPDLPWQLARVAICTVAFQFFYLGWCMVVDSVVGCDTLIKMPGEPPWIRDQKYRNWQPDMFHTSKDLTLPADYRLFALSRAVAPHEEHHEAGEHTVAVPGPVHLASGNATGNASNATAGEAHAAAGEAHVAGAHRRLTGAEGAVQDLMKTLPQLSWLADALEKRVNLSLQAPPLEVLSFEAPSFMAPAAKTAKVTWPAMFSPQHLLCKGSTVAALTSRGFGAWAQLQGDEPAKASPFAIEGVSDFGPLAGAAWTSAGLRLVTKSGELLACAGNGPVAGRWSCAHSATSKLPLPAGARLASAAIAERTAALIYEHLPAMIFLFKQAAAADDWVSAGEVHLPPHADGSVGLSFAGHELLAILGKSGEVHRRSLLDGTTAWHAPPPAAPQREFRSACAEPGSGLLRLALRQLADQHTWATELIDEQ